MTRIRIAIRPALAVSAGLAAVALLGACSSSGSSPSTATTGGHAASRTASSTAASSPAAAGGASGATTTGKTITATLTEFHIALSRASITPGTYTFEVKNAGRITHALTVDGKGVDDKSTSDLDPGQSATLTVTLAAGKYEVYCPVGDHKMEGMDTTVQVG